MTYAGPADQHHEAGCKQNRITRATVLKIFAIIALVSFVFRIIYAGHFFEDDGLWFAVGEEIVRGKALYRQIYFDKPPGLALLYALLFRIFGAHIFTIRLFGIAYSVAVSAMLYLFGVRFYDKRAALIAAAMFAVFSTTYFPGHVQGLGTDLLMILPYTAGAYLMIESRWNSRRQALTALAGGALAGIAFQINPKGLFDLAFFALLLIASRKWKREDATASQSTAGLEQRAMPAVTLFALSTAGFVLGSLPFLAYIVASHSLPEYWAYVWDWGARYGGYYSLRRTIGLAISRGADYFALNTTLLMLPGFVVVATIRRAWRARMQRSGLAPGATSTERLKHRADTALLIWFAVSYAGVMVGGRFFAHYFIQILPGLCLIGARGLTGLLSLLRTRSPMLRRAIIAMLALGFAFTLVRFHGRGALLAADALRGGVSDSNASWDYTIRDREERKVAAVLRGVPDESNAAEQFGLEAFRAGGPRTRTPDGPTDYVFVWGYRPEVYFWSGLLPASRYLSTQPLTGVPADVHYFSDKYRSLLDESTLARARAQLVSDLQETRPKYIVDEIGFFNADLAILKYPDLQEVLDGYKFVGPTGRFLLYIRRDLRGKHSLPRSPGQP